MTSIKEDMHEMKRPKNGYYLLIQKAEGKGTNEDEIVKIFGPFKSMWKLGKVEVGANININHEDYYTYGAWFGPDIEPTERCA